VLHHHRKFWELATAFIPERFTAEPSPWASNGAYLPFGVGLAFASVPHLLWPRGRSSWLRYCNTTGSRSRICGKHVLNLGLPVMILIGTFALRLHGASEGSAAQLSQPAARSAIA
jgi:hypothetical protein